MFLKISDQCRNFPVAIISTCSHSAVFYKKDFYRKLFCNGVVLYLWQKSSGNTCQGVTGRLQVCNSRHYQKKAFFVTFSLVVLTAVEVQFSVSASLNFFLITSIFTTFTFMQFTLKFQKYLRSPTSVNNHRCIQEPRNVRVFCDHKLKTSTQIVQGSYITLQMIGVI